jgi:hypothetical protein
MACSGSNLTFTSLYFPVSLLPALCLPSYALLRRLLPAVRACPTWSHSYAVLYSTCNQCKRLFCSQVQSYPDITSPSIYRNNHLAPVKVWTEISSHAIFRFIDILAISAQIAVGNQWRYIGVWQHIQCCHEEVSVERSGVAVRLWNGIRFVHGLNPRRNTGYPTKILRGFL